MKKPRDAFRLPATVWVFLLFLAMLTVANLLSPDRSFSPSENRMLSLFPDFSFKRLLDGDWTPEYETYVTDQFVLRDFWVGGKAAAERTLMKTENGGVYFAKEDHLIQRPTAAKESVIDTNVSSIHAFQAAVEAELTFALIPNSVTIDRELLPQYAEDGAQEAAIAEAYAGLTGSSCADIVSAMRAAKTDSPYLYYRTDHHPTSLGAYYIYKELCKPLGLTPHALAEYAREIASTSFRGTARAASGAWWVVPDEIEFFTLPNESYTLETYENGALVSSQRGLYMRENLAITDQYTAFLGGNHPLLIIHNENAATDEKLLLIKDSFSHAVAPFLADHYAEIHLVDLRYYRDHLIPYAAQEGFSQVLILYSVENFLSEKNLVYLNL